MQLSRLEVVSFLSAVLLFFSAHVFFEAPFWLLYVAVGCAAAIAFFGDRKRKSKSLPEPRRSKYVSPYTVKFDENEIVVSIDGKPHESVAWADLIVIGIRIENQGLIDVPYWILGGRSGGCMYPSDALGHEAVTDEFKNRLPGFHCKETYTTIAQAMTALEGGFVVWERPAENAT
jgi:hypothetical protein